MWSRLLLFLLKSLDRARPRLPAAAEQFHCVWEGVESLAGRLGSQLCVCDSGVTGCWGSARGSRWPQVGSAQAAGSSGYVISGLIPSRVDCGSCLLSSLILGVEKTCIRFLRAGDSNGGGSRIEGDGARVLGGKGLVASSGKVLALQTDLS